MEQQYPAGIRWNNDIQQALYGTTKSSRHYMEHQNTAGIKQNDIPQALDGTTISSKHETKNEPEVIRQKNTIHGSHYTTNDILLPLNKKKIYFLSLSNYLLSFLQFIYRSRQCIWYKSRQFIYFKKHDSSLHNMLMLAGQDEERATDTQETIQKSFFFRIKD